MDVALHQIWDVYSERRGKWIRGEVILIEFGMVTLDFDGPLDFGHYEISRMKSMPDKFRLVLYHPPSSRTASCSTPGPGFRTRGQHH